MSPFVIVIGGAVFVAFLVLIGVVAVQQAKKVRRGWAKAARTLRLHFASPGLFKNREMSGSIDGFFVRVDTYVISSGKTSQAYTRFRIKYPQGLGLGLKLSKQGFFNAVFQFFGSQDIEVGDPGFDDSVVVKGANAARIREFLTPARRVRIQRFFASCSGAKIEDTAVEWVQRGLIHDPQKLVSTVHNLLRVSASLCADRPEDASLTRAMGDLDAGNADKALTTVVLTTGSAGASPSTSFEMGQGEPASVESEAVEVDTSGETDPEVMPPAPVEEQVLAGELLYMAGKRDEAREAFEIAQTMAPDDPEISDWVEQAGQPERPLLVAEEEVIGEFDLDQHDVCDELFQPGVNSFHVNQRFEQSYQGRRVRWTGKLVRVESFRFDLVFGSSPGVKAVIEIHESDSMTYGDRKIKAVVELPESEYTRLRERVKQEILFEGLLLKVDGFMRNIYVGSGTLPAKDAAV